MTGCLSSDDIKSVDAPIHNFIDGDDTEEVEATLVPICDFDEPRRGSMFTKSEEYMSNFIAQSLVSLVCQTSSLHPNEDLHNSRLSVVSKRKVLNYRFNNQ